jgi:hypothetical protein
MKRARIKCLNEKFHLIIDVPCVKMILEIKNRREYINPKDTLIRKVYIFYSHAIERKESIHGNTR